MTTFILSVLMIAYFTLIYRLYESITLTQIKQGVHK